MKCIQHKMKENLLFLRDVLEHYFNVLDDIVNKYNNTVHRTIKMKPIAAMDDSYFEYNENFNKNDPKVGDHVRISKYKNLFAKGYTPNWSEEVFVFSKIKNTVPYRLMLLMI